MNSDEAKFILRARRAGGQDADDPQFAEAIELARRDPELAHWLAGEAALDAAIGAKLRSVPVPADLKASILTGHKIIPPPVAWWRRRVHPAAAAAAIFAVVGLFGYFGLREPGEGPARFAQFNADITEYIGKGYGLLLGVPRVANLERSYFGRVNYRIPFRAASLDDVRRWLGDNGGHRDFSVPASLRAPLNAGCAVLEWRGRRVSLIRFQTGPSLPLDKVHLAIISNGDLPDPPRHATPRIHEQADASTAEWNDERFTYILMAPGTGRTLAKFF